jgi:hypothetical protein
MDHQITPRLGTAGNLVAGAFAGVGKNGPRRSSIQENR